MGRKYPLALCRWVRLLWSRSLGYGRVTEDQIVWSSQNLDNSIAWGTIPRPRCAVVKRNHAVLISQSSGFESRLRIYAKADE